MSQAFKYNLIRFQPNTETGEFAVIGVVVYSPVARHIAYKLLPPDQHQRVTDFFMPMNDRILQGALERLAAELVRVQRLINQVNNPDALHEELTRERESIIRFAPAGAILSTEIQTCTNELFQRYIDRKYPLAA